MPSIWQRAIDLIAEQEWLDKPTDFLDQTFDRVLAKTGSMERHARNFLHGTWMGHPLHPTLTDIPLGAWTAAFIMDAMSSDDDETNKGADAAIAIGLVGAAGAAVSGLADWQATGRGKMRRIGTAHALANMASSGLYATSLALRVSGARGMGRKVSYLGYGLLGISGYLGGELVYGLKVGVSHTPDETPEGFVPVIDEAALTDGKPQRVDADGVHVLVVRANDRIYAITDDCPHLGCSLAEGTLEGGVIKCDCHGSRFRLEDGGLVDGPATFPATPFEVRVRDGKVEIRTARE